MQETQVQSLGREDSMEKGMATQPRILAWRIPWTEKSGHVFLPENSMDREVWQATVHWVTESDTLSLCPFVECSGLSSLLLDLIEVLNDILWVETTSTVPGTEWGLNTCFWTSRMYISPLTPTQWQAPNVPSTHKVDAVSFRYLPAKFRLLVYLMGALRTKGKEYGNHLPWKSIWE